MFLLTFKLIGVVLAVVYGYSIVRNYIRNILLIAKLPGPKTYLFLGNVPDLLCDEATLFGRIRKWSQEYYPVYKVSPLFFHAANISGPDDFEIRSTSGYTGSSHRLAYFKWNLPFIISFLDSTSNLKAIASTSKNIEKSIAYSFLYLWLGEGLLTSTGSKWQTRRKMLTPAFHFSILQQFIQVFANETDHLVQALKEVNHEPCINIVPYITQFTLSSINETSMGTKLNLDNEADKSYCAAIHKIGKIIAYRISRPWLFFNSIFYRFVPLGQKEKKLVKTLHDFTNNVISQRSKDFEKFELPINENDETFNYSKRKKLAMLDLLLNAKFSDGVIDDKGIQDEVNTFMFEGSDTTSMALCFTLLVLAQYNDIQELLLEEINTVLEYTKAQPTYNDLQELKFMERCIKECLRLFPSVPFIARKLQEDVLTSIGCVIPKGTTVNVHIFDIHRNPTIWPNPEKFDPDRFLQKNVENRHPFAYVPFSAGPRNCIGQRFAIFELKVALCGILRNFKLESVDTPENIKIVVDLILRPKDDIIRVKFVSRNE